MKKLVIIDLLATFLVNTRQFLQLVLPALHGLEYLLLSKENEVAKSLDVFDGMLAKCLHEYLVPNFITLAHLVQYWSILMLLCHKN